MTSFSPFRRAHDPQSGETADQPVSAPLAEENAQASGAFSSVDQSASFLQPSETRQEASFPTVDPSRSSPGERDNASAEVADLGVVGLGGLASGLHPISEGAAPVPDTVEEPTGFEERGPAAQPFVELESAPLPTTGHAQDGSEEGWHDEAEGELGEDEQGVADATADVESETASARLSEEPKPTPEEIQEDAPKLRPLPRVIALANQKGGVGKTTTTINLGAALAEADHRTLVIDLDPQGNATTGLGINSHALEHSIYDVLLSDLPMEDCIEPTDVLNLFIAPANLDLAGAEIELVPAMSRETRLKKAIAEVKADYDYILIDCPPSLGLLTVNALAAADEVMVPVQCEYFALEGLGQLIRNINLVQRNLNPELELSSIVLVMFDSRTKLAEQVAFEVREHFGATVCRNVIPRNIRLSEAPSFGQPITTFDPSSRGAVAYRELAREVHRVST